jgi:HEPN domain-containing protein
MAGSDEARMLLKMAGKDLRALENMLDADLFEDEIFGFHAQQAVEKSLKAWLAELGKEYPLTHNIRLLLTVLNTEGANTGDHSSLIELNVYAVQFRYEILPGDEPGLDRESLLREIRGLFNTVRKIVEP